MEKKKVSLKDMLPIIEEKLCDGGTVRIPITGTSMLPLLVAGRDTVVLKAAEKELKKHDLPLYRRHNGVFVLHRVLKAENGIYTMCGDNQWILEKGIEHSQIIGIVCEIEHKGKTLSVNSAKYKAYCRLWRALMPVRKYIVAVRGKLKK